MNFLILIRWKNLLITALTQILIKYALFEPFGVYTALNALHFSLLVIATLCITAGGYIINDIYDLDTDKINKPEKMIINKGITEKKAFQVFITLNVIGIGLALYLSNLIEKNSFAIIFFGVSVILYQYASFLKQIIFVKNIIIAVLAALAIMIVPIFDLLPVTNAINKEGQFTIFKIVFDYALFAFGINLVREIVKDLQDIDGDHKAGINTLPIAIGRERTNKIVMALLTVFTIGVTYYVITYLYKQYVLVGYFLVLIIGPLVYTLIKLFLAETKLHYKKISRILKLIMVLGVLSLLLYPFILK